MSVNYRISWDAVAGSYGYLVEYRRLSGTTWTTPSTSANPTLNTYYDLVLESGVSYAVRVSSVGLNCATTYTIIVVDASGGGGGGGPLEIAGEITLFCTVDDSSQGIVQLEITFDSPTPAEITLLFGQVTDTATSGHLRVGDNIMSTIPPGTTGDPYYDSVGVGHQVPWECTVPAGTSTITFNPPLGNFSAEQIWQLGAPHNPLSGGPWICSTDPDYGLLDLYIKIESSDYIANFTLTNIGVTIHNEY